MALKKTLKKVIKTAGKFIAPVGAGLIGAGLAKTMTSKKAKDKKQMASAAGSSLKSLATGAAVGVGAYGAYTLADKYLFDGKLPLGAAKGQGTQRKYRRINPLNYKAASRATKRIKGAMDMLKKIEKQLPKQKVKSSVGLITAKEASRALAR